MYGTLGNTCIPRKRLRQDATDSDGYGPLAEKTTSMTQKPNEPRTKIISTPDLGVRLIEGS